MLLNYEEIKAELRKFVEKGGSFKNIEKITADEVKSVYKVSIVKKTKEKKNG